MSARLIRCARNGRACFYWGAVSGWAQVGPEQGGHEIQVWVAGGHSVPGGTQDTNVADIGVRYGWIITGAFLPSLLRGRFEYAVDAVPLYLVFQPANTAYGAGFDPLVLKWNFSSGVGNCLLTSNSAGARCSATSTFPLTRTP